ncbi:unnamed protein product [Clonostachys rosea]|uniref:Uncharacterized protein n=1 Tax=Bionectria ochroleuca TaxID=29856 RepID=A0ABY6U2J4_BIOOC|nr:unnamed protein product [Clonostachys rosea]
MEMFEFGDEDQVQDNDSAPRARTKVLYQENIVASSSQMRETPQKLISPGVSLLHLDGVTVFSGNAMGRGGIAPPVHHEETAWCLGLGLILKQNLRITGTQAEEEN